MDYATVNAIACQCAGIKPTLPSAWQGLSKHISPAFRGSDADITFKGLALNVELDCYGNVEGLYSLADGTDCLDIFKDWALTEIQTLAKLAQLEAA